MSDLFQAEGVKYSDEMFTGCESLPNYKSSATDASMANYKTGYFKTYYKTGSEIHPMHGERLEVENLSLTDGEDFKTYAPFTANQTEYSRIMENTWGTLCLPYAISPADVDGGRLYCMETINDNILLLKEVDANDQVEAGEAVLIKRIGDAGSNIRICTANSEIVKAPISGNADEARLVGTFAAMQVPDDAYVIAKDKFWLVSDVTTEGKSVWTAGMRAYIQPAKSMQTQPSVLSIADGTATTSIDMLNAASDGKAEIFDINGRRQNALQKGLNIIRQAGVTKKVYIK